MADLPLIDAVIVILASVCGIALLTYFKLPPIIGYLLAGLSVGPNGLRLVTLGEGTSFLAELGVIFLMFMVGLKFSLPAIIAARADVFGAGGLQVCLTAIFIAVGLLYFGVGWAAALLIGGAVAMSSTALTLKQLGDQDELASQHGRYAIGILLFQDLATLPFLILVHAWRQNGALDIWALLLQLVIAIIAMALVAAVSRPVFRTLLTWVGSARSPDLFLLTILLIALGTAFLGHKVGLPGPIGAFLAGMIVGESDFRHQVDEDIRPFRDVLLGLFFVTVGINVNPASLLFAPWTVVAWLIVLLPGKILLTLAVATIMRWPATTALRLAVVLAHGGEFGLLLLTQAIDSGLLDPATGQSILMALAISMTFAPILIFRNAPIAHAFAWPIRRRKSKPDGNDQLEMDSMRDHALICGCGRVGRLVATVFEAANLPYIAIESDSARFNEARLQNHRVMFGDASRRRILERAGLPRARLLVVTFDRWHEVDRLLHHAHHRNPTLPSIVSIGDDLRLSEWTPLGATVVFPENHAAGLGLADQALLLVGFEQEDAAKIVTRVRAELNPELEDRVGI